MNWKQATSCLCLILLISGCSTKNGLIDADEPKIDESLESVNSESVRSISGIESIAFEWQKVDDLRVNGYNLYRANTSDEGGKLKQVEFIKNRYSTHFVDEDLEPNTKYVYAFSSNTKKGFESKPTKAITITTLDRPDAISFIQAISNLPKQIKVLWRPHTGLNIEYYKVQRSTPTTAEWDNIETLDGRLQSEFIDEDLKDNVVYMYRVVAYTFNDVPSYASKIVQAQTKPLPADVQNLRASNNLPRRIMLNWEPSSNQDIVHHNIYRNSSATGSFDLIKVVSKDTLSFDDFVNEDGKVYFYKVTVTDVDNLESSVHKNAVMGISLEKLNKPVLTLAQIQGQKAILNWQKGDSRAVSFNVYKRIKENAFSSKEEKFTNINDLRFEDNDIVRGVEYNYSIESVDENGIVSDKTNETLLVLPKLQGTN